MPIKMTCPHCGQSRRVNDRLAGRKVRCPACEQPIRVPELPPQSDSGSRTAGEAERRGDDQVQRRQPDDASERAPIGSADQQSAYAESAHLGPPVSAEDLFDDAEHSELGGRGKHSAADLHPAPVLASAGGHIGHRQYEQHPESLAPIDVPHAADMFPAEEDDDDAIDEVLVRSKKPEEEMDMTPMVDVTFLLLIFFMVTAAFSLQKSIQMPRQQTEAPSPTNVEPEEDVDAVEVEVDEFGSFLVLAPEWERETPGKQNLITALREANAGKTDPMKLKVKIHEAAKVKVLVDAMDAGTIANYSPIEVTQVEQFD